MSKHKQNRAGFTLIEMMITIGIIGAALALAAPSVRSALANRRNQQASLDVLSLALRARSDALSLGRAHMLRFSDGANANGKVELFRGINNGCNTNDWVTIMSGPACGQTNSYCLGYVDMEDFASTAGTLKMTPVDNAGLELCYSSSGVMMWRTDDGTSFNQNAPSGSKDFIVNFERMDGTTVVGVARSLMFPMGGMPRMTR